MNMYTLEDTGISWSGINNVSSSSAKYTSFTYLNDGTWIPLSSGEKAILVSTYYSYKKSDYSINSNVVFPDSGYYWLASQFICCWGGYGYYGCRAVNVSRVSSATFFYTYGSEDSNYGGVRPIVCLATDVSLELQSDGTYEIVN